MQGRVGLLGSSTGGESKDFGSGRVGVLFFESWIVDLVMCGVSTSKRRKLAFFEGCPVGWGGVPTGAGLVDGGVGYRRGLRGA